MTLVQYYYYSSSSKFPILTVEYQAQTSGTTTTNKVDILVNTVAQSVGINENVSATTNFIVYPNPVNNNVHVVLPNNETASLIEIIDITGKTVASNVNSNTVNVSMLAKAVYTIRVKNKDVVLQKQIVIAE